MTVSRIVAGGVWFGLCLLAAADCAAGTSNSLLDISADGQLLACSNRDAGTVTLIQLPDLKKLREVPVGATPEGVTFLGDSHQVAVAVYGDDQIVLLDADTGETLHTIPVFDEPYGLVSSPDGRRLYATLDYPGQVVTIDVATAAVVAQHNAGSFLRGLALAGEPPRLYVTEYYTATVIALAPETGQILDRWPAASTDNLARQLIPHPRRPKLYVPHIRSRVTAVHGEGSIFPYLSVIDTRADQERRRTRIPMDAFLGNRVTANPWEVAVSADGRKLAIVFSGTNDMFVCDVVDDDYREVTYRGYVTLGHNPRAVRFSPDGLKLYVYNALDFELVAYDAESLRAAGKVAVCENPLGGQVLQGKRLFYSALPPMVGRRWISCSSCHPDGQPDGRTWHNPEGLRNTQSLAGLLDTHPIHWSADRDEVQDFEHTIRGPLMQGRGLIPGRVNESLAEPNAGRSAEADALAAYTNSHKFALSPHGKQGLSAEAARGRELFFSRETACASCHSGKLYTDSAPGPADKLVRHDVGTGQDDPTEKMGPAFDTPSLLGVYRTAPYLHHGRAATLEDVLTTCNPDDRHGKTSHLNPGQIADLVEFLKALPYAGDKP
ncbi:MAG: c-type cytochrome [Pirellulaceae bacterium]|nr:c-type cytochrome [Pirellulaceae bacterium]